MPNTLSPDFHKDYGVGLQGLKWDFCVDWIGQDWDVGGLWDVLKCVTSVICFRCMFFKMMTIWLNFRYCAFFTFQKKLQREIQRLQSCKKFFFPSDSFLSLSCPDQMLRPVLFVCFPISVCMESYLVRKHIIRTQMYVHWKKYFQSFGYAVFRY